MKVGVRGVIAEAYYNRTINEYDQEF